MIKYIINSGSGFVVSAKNGIMNLSTEWVEAKRFFTWTEAAQYVDKNISKDWHTEILPITHVTLDS